MSQGDFFGRPYRAHPVYRRDKPSRRALDFAAAEGMPAERIAEDVCPLCYIAPGYPADPDCGWCHGTGVVRCE